jgi:hypothetical protein
MGVMNPRDIRVRNQTKVLRNWLWQKEIYPRRSQIYRESNERPSVGVFDPNLANPKGMVQISSSPFWVSHQVTNLWSVYTGTGSKVV